VWANGQKRSPRNRNHRFQQNNFFIIFSILFYSATLPPKGLSQEEEGYIFIDLLRLSDLYSILDLKDICQVHLKAYVTKQNVLEFVELATIYNAKNLSECCIEYLSERYRFFADKPEYLSLDPEFQKMALHRYQCKNCWMYQEPQRAPWVEKYLELPHDRGLRSGQDVSDDFVLRLGYDPKTEKSWRQLKKKV